MEQETADQRTPLLKSSPTSSSPTQGALDMPNDALDAEFGGLAARQELEKRLLWKVDKRMSILVLIYILNFVRSYLLFDYECGSHLRILFQDRPQQCRVCLTWNWPRKVTYAISRVELPVSVVLKKTSD